MNVVLEKLRDVEFVAEQILSDKQQIVNFDIQRQKNREAFNHIKKKDDNDKVWISYGNMFIKIKSNKAKEMITKDQNSIDTNINELRNDLKDKMCKLRVLEGKPELKGVNLKGLDRKELMALKDIVPEVANF